MMMLLPIRSGDWATCITLLTDVAMPNKPDGFTRRYSVCLLRLRWSSMRCRGQAKKAITCIFFFELGDGNFIAFFDEPETATAEHFHRKDSFDLHIALEADSFESTLAWQAHIGESGKTCLGPVNHGFVHSIYMYDPNGIQVEITCKDHDYASIMAADGAAAHEQLRDWTKRTRVDKASRFGTAALDHRGH